MKPIFAVVSRLLAGNRLCILITAIPVLLSTTSADSAVALSRGNYFWLAALLAPIIVVFCNFEKLIYLGATKKAYYFGSLLTYTLMAVVISLLNTATRLLIDPLNHTQTVINLMDVCSWWANGPVTAWLQQALFLLTVMIFLHVLFSMQTHWYGWLTDAVLVAVISIFTPIAALRGFLSGFFRLIMLNGNAPLHLAVCALLSVLLALAGLAVLKQKTL